MNNGTLNRRRMPAVFYFHREEQDIRETVVGVHTKNRISPVK